MANSTLEHNPFMLLVHPELVLAAVEKSERLGQLNRHLCRPLDRPVGGQAAPAGSTEDESEDLGVETNFQTQ